MTYTKEQIRFLKSLDFMKLGQAISHEQWQSAAMIVRRLEQNAQKADFYTAFERQFVSLRQNINRKNVYEAKQILALVVNKRALYLNNKAASATEEAANAAL